MFGILDAIKDTVASFGQLVLWALASAVNLLIEALGALLGVVLGVLPNMPEPLDAPNIEAVGWIAYFFPAAEVVAFALALIVSYLLLLIWRVALRWVKAL